MSQTTKLVLGVAIAVMVLGSGYAYWKNTQIKAGQNNPAEVTTLPSGKETTNTALDQDLSAIDAQLQAVSSDNANVSASVTNVQTQ